MIFSFEYRKPLISDIKAPYLPLIISDPLEKIKVEELGFINTGYDREILIPLDFYRKLNLNAFEY